MGSPSQPMKAIVILYAAVLEDFLFYDPQDVSVMSSRLPWFNKFHTKPALRNGGTEFERC